MMTMTPKNRPMSLPELIPFRVSIQFFFRRRRTRIRDMVLI